MLPALIYFLVRKFRHQHVARLRPVFPPVLKTFGIIIAILACISIAVVTLGQEKRLEYQIKRKGAVVGNILVSQSILREHMVLKLQSEVKTRFLFLFTAKAHEESIYDNGILTWSSIFRQLNGREKANQNTRIISQDYIVQKGTQRQTLGFYPIRYNMLSLFVKEPANIDRVYSDNFQQFLHIENLGDSGYRIRFPDGSFNDYTYHAGYCTRIEVHHSLYSAVIELKTT